MSEAGLCDRFMAGARAHGWTPYPECAGWDIVLVNTDCQIGIEAKLRPSIEALAQVVVRCKWSDSGPLYVAVLAPRPSRAYRTVAAELRIHIYDTTALDTKDRYLVRRFYEEPPKTLAREWADDIALPPIVPKRQAGLPSPSPLTPWRVAALKLCAVLRAKGHVTPADFKAAGIDSRRWTDNHRWLKPGAARGEWLGNFEAPDFPDRGWEAERDEIARTT